ncbi:uncharacterized protein LOC110824088 isoform X1 [Carica papaya]|uniref:uncharacterized protein LOC110824088 isoform X1 n=1 Tax=Carica papaya TaxID=3649 RepID=UPI000B8C8C19|nr:uncharacterized protein LOC110824088 isoform X1 [Carica papaya]
MAATSASSFFPCVSPLNSSANDSHEPFKGLLCPHYCKPFASWKPTPALKCTRLSSAHITAVAPKRAYRSLTVSGLVDDGSGTNTEEELSNSSAGATFDIKLPRRSLLVQFTCNACGERTKRLINRLAYERGAVFVQCAGCLQHHKLVDNLGLVVEYDLRETNVNSSTDQV